MLFDLEKDSSDSESTTPRKREKKRLKLYHLTNVTNDNTDFLDINSENQTPRFSNIPQDQNKTIEKRTFEPEPAVATTSISKITRTPFTNQEIFKLTTEVNRMSNELIEMKNHLKEVLGLLKSKNDKFPSEVVSN